MAGENAIATHEARHSGSRSLPHAGGFSDGGGGGGGAPAPPPPSTNDDCRGE